MSLHRLNRPRLQELDLRKRYTSKRWFTLDYQMPRGWRGQVAAGEPFCQGHSPINSMHLGELYAPRIGNHSLTFIRRRSYRIPCEMSSESGIELLLSRSSRGVVVASHSMRVSPFARVFRKAYFVYRVVRNHLRRWVGRFPGEFPGRRRRLSHNLTNGSGSDGMKDKGNGQNVMKSEITGPRGTSARGQRHVTRVSKSDGGEPPMSKN